MNTIEFSNVEYIRASRTIETLRLKNSERIIYIYNYEGTHFRFFTDLIGLIQFFQLGVEPTKSFSKEEDLDNFIQCESSDKY